IDRIPGSRKPNVLEREPVASGGEPRSRKSGPAAGRHHSLARDEQVAIAAEEDASPAVVEHERRRAQRFDGAPITSLECLLMALDRSGCRVRRDTQWIGTQRLEPRPRLVELVGIVKVPLPDSIAVMRLHDDGRVLERPFRLASYPSGDSERPSMIEGEDVVRAQC